MVGHVEQKLLLIFLIKFLNLKIMLNSVIVDDEITNTDHLSLMIKRSASNVKILGSADSVESGVSLIKEKKPLALAES